VWRSLRPSEGHALIDFGWREKKATRTAKGRHGESSPFLAFIDFSDNFTKIKTAYWRMTP
jgi:hypothetical protein